MFKFQSPKIKINTLLRVSNQRYRGSLWKQNGLSFTHHSKNSTQKRTFSTESNNNNNENPNPPNNKFNFPLYISLFGAVVSASFLGIYLYDGRTPQALFEKAKKTLFITTNDNDKKPSSNSNNNEQTIFRVKVDGTLSPEKLPPNFNQPQPIQTTSTHQHENKKESDDKKHESHETHQTTDHHETQHDLHDLHDEKHDHEDHSTPIHSISSPQQSVIEDDCHCEDDKTKNVTDHHDHHEHSAHQTLEQQGIVEHPTTTTSELEEEKDALENLLKLRSVELIDDNNRNNNDISNDNNNNNVNIQNLVEEIIKISNEIEVLKQIPSLVKEKFDEQAKSYDQIWFGILQEFHQHYGKLIEAKEQENQKLLSSFKQISQEYSTFRNHVYSEFEERLEQDREKLLQLAKHDLQLLANDLKQQYEREYTKEAEVKFQQFIQHIHQKYNIRLDELINGLTEVESKYQTLSKTMENTIENEQRKTERIKILYKLNRILNDNQDPAPKKFSSELSTLKKLSQEDVLLHTVVHALPQNIETRGVLSYSQLVKNFKAVADHGKRAALLPESGSGGISGSFARLLSHTVIPAKGLVEGNDSESHLARAEYFLERHDLFQAVNEVRKLQGEPLNIMSGWLNDANDRLALEKTVDLLSDYLL